MLSIFAGAPAKYQAVTAGVWHLPCRHEAARSICGEAGRKHEALQRTTWWHSASTCRSLARLLLLGHRCSRAGCLDSSCSRSPRWLGRASLGDGARHQRGGGTRLVAEAFVLLCSSHHQDAHVEGLGPLGVVPLVKLHACTDLEPTTASHLDVLLVDKDISGTVVSLDEAPAPVVVPADDLATHARAYLVGQRGRTARCSVAERTVSPGWRAVRGTT